MAAPQTKRHATLVSDFASAAQGASTTPLDFSQGSVLLALGEATAGLGTWLQKLYLFALSVTRLRSSRGVWVDTFVNAYGMARFGAIAATGPCVFSRITATSRAVVPVGSLVGTEDGTQTFAVYADATNGAYSAADNGYVLLPGANAIPVPVRALTVGAIGNVQARTITRLKSATGVDNVVNVVAFTTGQDPEQDGAVQARFPLYLASLFRATRGALAYAVSALGQGLQTSFAEFQHPDGTADTAFNTVFVDDGSGAPSTALVAASAQAVENYRAFGVRVGVFPASRIDASVTMSIEVGAGYTAQTVVAAVVAALTLYINGLGLAQPLYYSRLIDVAYGASNGVTNVSGVMLNAGVLDLIPTTGQTIKARNISIIPIA